MRTEYVLSNQELPAFVAEQLRSKHQGDSDKPLSVSVSSVEGGLKVRILDGPDAQGSHDAPLYVPVTPAETKSKPKKNDGDKA